MSWRRFTRSISRPFREVARIGRAVFRAPARVVDGIVGTDLSGDKKKQRREMERQMEAEQARIEAEQRRAEQDQMNMLKYNTQLMGDRNGFNSLAGVGGGAGYGSIGASMQGAVGGGVAPIVEAIKIARENAQNNKQTNLGKSKDDDEEKDELLRRIKKGGQ